MITEEYFGASGAFFTECTRLAKACGSDAIITATFHLISKETISVSQVLNAETNKAEWVMKPYTDNGMLCCQVANVDNTENIDSAHARTTSVYRKIHISIERIGYVEISCTKSVVTDRANKQETAE